jgi:hypothetical protein
MNIHEIEALLQTGSKPSPTHNEETGDKDFEKILKSTLSEINKINKNTLSDTNSTLLMHGDKVLSLLDNYAQNLNNPNKTLRDIEPLIGEIEKEITFIETEATKDTYKNDEELQNLLNELALTANVNIYKFYRGDFS